MIVHVYSLFGLGGAIWSWPIRDYVCSSLSNIKGVRVAPTYGFTEWRQIAAQIKAQPKGDKSAIISHSMGCGGATYVTDLVKVDLVVCYDTAGQAPSYIGNNTGKLLDFWDRAFALVPKYRPKALKGHSAKINQTITYDGHTGQPGDPKLLRIVTEEINKLKG